MTPSSRTAGDAPLSAGLIAVFLAPLALAQPRLIVGASDIIVIGELISPATARGSVRKPCSL